MRQNVYGVCNNINFRVMKKLAVAILGSSSHIARGLVDNFLEDEKINLHLFTRSGETMHRFLKALKKVTPGNYLIHEGYDEFNELSYDVIVNCTGSGTLRKPQFSFTDYFTINETYDNFVIEYLLKVNPRALYISFSSGAIYGKDYSKPAEEHTVNCLKVNHIVTDDYYSIVRLNSEAKHRAYTRLNIVDLRLFAYFSRFADLTDDYFIVEIINCLLKNNTLITSETNFVRDYIGPEDLYRVVRRCMNKKILNAAFDIASVQPVSKREILDYFTSEYGLKYRVSPSFSHVNATGFKNKYYSVYDQYSVTGYKPKFTSLATIKHEAEYLLAK